MPHRNPQDPPNPRRLRGDETELPQPPRELLPVHPASNVQPYAEQSEGFYVWMLYQDMWTFSYTPEMYETMFDFQSKLPEEWMLAKHEVYPSQDNKWVARKHGTYSMYTSGCRGPMCKWANRVHGRDKGDFNPQNENISDLDVYISMMVESTWLYLEYIKYVRNWRIANLPRRRYDPLNWRKVTLRDTLMMDVTTF